MARSTWRQWLRLNGEYAFAWALVFIGAGFGVAFVQFGEEPLAWLSVCITALGFFGVYHFEETAISRVERALKELYAQHHHDHHNGV